MLINLQKTLTATVIIMSAFAMSMSANAMQPKILSIAPDFIDIERNINLESINKI